MLLLNIAYNIAHKNAKYLIFLFISCPHDQDDTYICGLLRTMLFFCLFFVAIVCVFVCYLCVYLLLVCLLQDDTRMCGFLGTVSSALMHDCLMALGFSEPCVTIWEFNILNTKQECFEVCLLSYITSEPNNKPDGSLNDCLQCDEDKSGPNFKYFSGRTRYFLNEISITNVIQLEINTHQIIYYTVSGIM